MSCKGCSSDRQGKFSAEINVHFPGLAGLDKPTVRIFPELLVCLDCGFTEFQVAETELRQLAEGIKDEGAVASESIPSIHC